jgi:hypothetical protein
MKEWVEFVAESECKNNSLHNLMMDMIVVAFEVQVLEALDEKPSVCVVLPIH